MEAEAEVEVAAAGSANEAWSYKLRSGHLLPDRPSGGTLKDASQRLPSNRPGSLVYLVYLVCLSYLSLVPKAWTSSNASLYSLSRATCGGAVLSFCRMTH